MSTQSSSNQISLHLPNPDKSLQFRQVEEFESENLFHDHIQGEDENAQDVQMADHLRPMEELLRIPIVGIEIAIVIPAVLADEFELKTELLDFLILFPFSLKGAAETWLENEPPCSITTWDDLVSKFLNRFYPHSKTRELRKEITKFQQVSVTEAWERFKNLLRKCPHHGFSFPHQIDFFYNGLSQSDQDFLNTRASGNLMSKNTHEALTIIENKAKDLEPETITEVVEIPSSQSTPLVPPLETPPLSTPKPKEDPKPNRHQPLIPYPSRLQEEKFQALENPTGRADHFVYRIDIVDSLCDKFPIENNSMSGNPTPSSDSVETNILLSHFDDSPPEYETFSFDIEEKSSGSTTTHFDYSLSDYEAFSFDIDHIEEKSSGSTTTHSDFSLPEYDSFIFDLSIDPDNEIYDSEGDILFLENLLKG
ncbi:reverse transcriptase domain-containing protein [Tanacetum coccineum]